MKHLANMRRAPYLCLLISIFILGSCNNNDYGPVELTHINLDNAKLLFIAHEKNSYMLEEGRLYMVSVNDEIKQIELTTDKGKDFYDQNYIVAACNVNKDIFAIKTSGYQKHNYLVEKSSGDVFNVDQHGVFSIKETGNNNSRRFDIVTTDSRGFVYFNDYDTDRIIRMDISDLHKIKSEAVSLEGDNVQSFLVDKDGNLAYSAKFNFQDVLRAVSNDKSEIKQLPSSESSSREIRFKGWDGYIYYQYEGFSRLTFNPITLTQHYAQEGNRYCSDDFILVENKKTTVAIGECYNVIHFKTDTTSIDNNDNLQWDIDEMIIAKANSNFYYFSYKNSEGRIIFKKVDPDNMMFEDLIEERYEVIDFEATDDNCIYFNAFDDDEITTVFGKITPSGEIQILYKELSEYISFCTINDFK